MSKSAENLRLAVFASRKAAEAAVRALVAAGIPSSEISLFVQADAPKVRAGRHNPEIDESIEVGGETGAGIGAMAGGLGGVLAGLGLLAVPGVGPVLAVGPLAAALTGAISGGAVGGFAGSFAGLGISDAVARAAEKHLKVGRALVLVRSDDRNADATMILEAQGALEEDSLDLEVPRAAVTPLEDSDG